MFLKEKEKQHNKMVYIQFCAYRCRHNTEKLDQILPREEEWVVFKFIVHLLALVVCLGEVDLLSSLTPSEKFFVKTEVIQTNRLFYRCS